MKYLVIALVAALSFPSAFADNGTVLIPSAKIDLVAGTATLPLHQGQLQDGTKFWFILTDTSKKAAATHFGIDFAPSLSELAQAKSTRHVHVDSAGNFTFDHGTVDFTPVRSVVPGDAPNFFPPKAVTPGSVASADYSPFAVADDASGTVYNAPIIATGEDLNLLLKADGTPDYTLVHDKVVGIDTVNSFVVLKLTHGFTDGHNVVYLSFDANVALAATLEEATLAPAEADLLGSSAAFDLYALANGETGSTNPERQGFNSALAGEGSPLNILTLPANGTIYSPLWNVHVGAWTSAAIANGDRKRLKNGADVLAAAQSGVVTNPDGTPLSSAGIVVNCPVVQVLNQ